MDKLARLQARDLCHHLQKKGIRGNVERHSEKGVCTALVELEAQLTIGHIKLEKAVAWRQFHGLYVRHIPGTDNHAARVGIVLDLMKHLFDLVDMAAIVVLPCSPLTAIHRTEVAMLIGPLIPNADTVVLQILHIGVALQEPQQFVNDGFQMHFLGSDQRKTIFKIETHLMAKHTDGACAGAVVALHTFCGDALQ